MIDTQRLIESGATVNKTPLRDVKNRWDMLINIVKNDDIEGLKDAVDSANKFNPFAVNPDTGKDVIQYIIIYEAIRVFKQVLGMVSKKDKHKLLGCNKYITLAIENGHIEFVKLLLKDNPYVKDTKYNYIDEQKTILSDAIQWYDPTTMSPEFYGKCRQILFMLINAGLIKDNLMSFSETIDGYNVEFELTMSALARYYNHGDRIVNALSGRKS